MPCSLLWLSQGHPVSPPASRGVCVCVSRYSHYRETGRCRGRPWGNSYTNKRATIVGVAFRGTYPALSPSQPLAWHCPGLGPCLKQL